jgi:aryl-alcohol dehydrogenase-like predicted oxidoreductase
MELCLGTAQLGMQYGINSEGKPNFRESIRILNDAYSMGVNIFDTASLYGNSEQIIGEFLKEAKLEKEISIITKAQHTNKKTIFESLKDSLDKLQIDCVNGYMLHEAKDMYDIITIENMKDIKSRGLVKNLGVSIYETEDAIYASEQNWIDYIQIPYNIFDQRLNYTDFFLNTKRNNKKIFARSPFLQGLLLMKTEEVIIKLPFAQKESETFNKIINKYSSTNLEAAIQFVKANDQIDYLVFGVDNSKQLSSIIDNFNQYLVNTDMIKELIEAFRNVDNRIIMPNLW